MKKQMKNQSRGSRSPTSVWIESRRGRRGTSYRVRWIDPSTGLVMGEPCGRDRALARDRRDAKRTELRDGASGCLPTKSVTDLRDALSTFMAGKSPNTIHKTQGSLGKLVEHCGDRRLVRIDRAALMDFRAKRLDEKVSVATVNKDLRQIKSALSYAANAGWLRFNPMRSWKGLFLTEPKKAIRVVEPEEFSTLLGKVECAALKVLLVVAYYLGLRRSELANLRWDAVNLEKRSICIQNVVEAGELTKSRKIRTVPLHESARKALAEHFDQVGKVVANGKAEPKYPHVFTWENGDQFKPDWLSRWFTKLVGEAGIPAATLHDLRRSFSTLAQRAGVDKMTVKDLGGWSSVVVVEKHYSGEVPEALERAMRQIEAAQGKAG